MKNNSAEYSMRQIARQVVDISLKVEDSYYAESGSFGPILHPEIDAAQAKLATELNIRQRRIFNRAGLNVDQVVYLQNAAYDEAGLSDKPSLTLFVDKVEETIDLSLQDLMIREPGNGNRGTSVSWRDRVTYFHKK
jgi:hypothetical protein